jgi:hypothetical protein
LGPPRTGLWRSPLDGSRILMKTVESPLPPRKENAPGEVYRAGCPLVKLHRGGDRPQRPVAAVAGSGDQRKVLIDFPKTIPGTLHLCLEEGTHSHWLCEVLSPPIPRRGHGAPGDVAEQTVGEGPTPGADSSTRNWTPCEDCNNGPRRRCWTSRTGTGSLGFRRPVRGCDWIGRHGEDAEEIRAECHMRDRIFHRGAPRRAA